MKSGVAARLSGAFLLWCGLASPALADWHVAESENFVIYADDSAKDVGTFGEYLERYHSAMELLTARDLPPPSPSNRVTIFVVGDQRDIRELAGSDSRFIAGFYVPRAGASRAFVQDLRLSHRETSFSMIILLHEYAHHFLISSSRYSMPRWLSEGSAEFFASTRFLDDGSVSIGRPAIHRAAELAYSREVSMDELFDHKLYEEKRSKRHDSYYGRSWMLYHFLRFSEERAGQLSAYGRALGAGVAPLEAARTAFGDFRELERDLDSYARQRRMLSYTLTPEMLKIGPVTVRKLSEGEAEMMPVRIRSQRGVDPEQAAELVVEARTIAEGYPDDAGVMAALAEAEFDAGNDNAAIAAADRAIAIDPTRKNAYVQKGYALFRMAETADDRDAAYTAAMAPFTALNGLENDHPLPLIYYYRSFAERGEEPPENARHALERAAQLAPFDKGLWFQVAMMLAQEGKIELARLSLAPVAADPHGGSLADQAGTIIAQLQKAEEGTAFRPAMVVAVPEVAAAEPEDEPSGD